MENSELKSLPARNCFPRSNIDSLATRKFDVYKQRCYSPSFISMVENSFQITELKLLEELVPQNINGVYDINEISAKISKIISSYGIAINETLRIIQHRDALVQIIVNECDSTSIFSMINEYDQNYQEKFSFCSLNILDFLEIKKHILPSVVIMVFTPMGFFRIHLEDADFTCSTYVFVLSYSECIIIRFGEINMMHMNNIFIEKSSNKSFFKLVDFKYISGIFQPIFSDESFNMFITNISSIQTRLDGLNFPICNFSSETIDLIGLIGKYSQIYKYIKDNDLKIDVIEHFDNIDPFIGLYGSGCSNKYMFLFLPSDLPLNHPNLSDVSKYASSLMRRVCSRLLILTEKTEFKLKIKYNLNGLGIRQNSNDVRFLGCNDTSIVMNKSINSNVGVNGSVSLFFSCYNDLLQWKLFNERKYKIHMTNINQCLPMNLSDHFQNACGQYLANEVENSCDHKSSPLDFKNYCEQCFEEINQIDISEEYILEFESLDVYDDTLIRANFHWSESGQLESQSNSFHFYHIIDGALIDGSHITSPVLANEIAILYSLPQSFSIINSYYIVERQTLIIISILGKSLWINSVKSGYNDSFLPLPLLELDIDFKAEKMVKTAYAELSGLLILLVSQNDEQVLYSILLSRSFDSASIIASIPIRSLIPILSNKEYMIDIALVDDGTRGFFFYTIDNEKSQNKLISFDPWNLSVQAHDEQFKQIYQGIFQIDETALLISANGEGIGVVNWRGKPHVAKFAPNEGVCLLIEDEEISKFTFNEVDSVVLAADSNERYGFSEVERRILGSYPEDLATIDTVFDANPYNLEKYFDAGREYARDGSKLNLFAHQSPASNIEIKRSIFPLIHRFLGAPRFLVEGKIIPTTIYEELDASLIIEASIIRRRSKMPPFTLIREICAKSIAMPCLNISVVNVNGADGSQLLSAFCGIQFMLAPRCSVRLGTCLLPTEFNVEKKFTAFKVLNALSFAPHDSCSKTQCAISLIHAMLCTGVVIVYMNEGYCFAIDVLKKLAEIIHDIETYSRCAFHPDLTKIILICDLGCDEYQSKEQIRDGISSIISGYSEEDTVYKLLNQEFTVVSNKLDDIALAADLANSIEFPEVPVEESLSNIVSAAASFGAFMDNLDLFE